LPENSSGVRAAAVEAAVAAAWPALRAPLAAVCCRPRAFPPAFAARLRAGVAVDERLAELDFRAEVELDLRAVAPLLRAVDLRAVAPLLRAVDLRAVAPLLRAVDLRAVDPDDLRADDPLDALFRVDDPLARRREDDPLPLPLFDSAIALLL
jgi:hypothetical protein